MKIATWNVNSIRTRLQHVTDWLTQHADVDLLCLQETKVTDEQFPTAAFSDLGYHLDISGQKSYNGVAMIARSPLDDVSKGFAAVLDRDQVGEFDQQKRLISGVIQGIRVVNLYVPNGGSIGSDKYHYKLQWLNLLQQYLTHFLQDSPSLVICGDFNIALEDIDIYDPTGRETHIMASDTEREALRQVLSVGLKDVFRKFTHEGGHFSWWDYRAGSFRRNAGWRIDHHYVTEDLYQRAIGCTIDTAPRKLTQPSDHAPVILEI
jgi:exodeoxyribonuclease-3